MNTGTTALNLLHENGFFADGRNVGYFPQGIRSDDDSQIGRYQFSGPYYEDTLMQQAVNNMVNSGRFRPRNSRVGSYDLVAHNCQDFAEALKEEYKRLGGQTCPVGFDNGVCRPLH